MKKLFIIACALTLLTTNVMAAETNTKTDFRNFQKTNIQKQIPPAKEKFEQHRKQKEEAFEHKLGLTEVQKLKARELRKSGFEKIKPVMDELKSKKQEADKIQKSNLSVEEKESKLTVLDKDIASLKKQAKEIRKQNMKDFEGILTKEQKKTLKQMKKEGRNKFHKEHRAGMIPPPPCPKEQNR